VNALACHIFIRRPSRFVKHKSKSVEPRSGEKEPVLVTGMQLAIEVLVYPAIGVTPLSGVAFGCFRRRGFGCGGDKGFGAVAECAVALLTC
jgi:hypothetical protein